MIYVVGLGPGDDTYLTQRGREVIKASEVLIGAKRNLVSIQDFKGIKQELDSDLGALLAYLKANRCRDICILASGDPLLYGIGKFLSENLPKQDLEIISGISAIQYMFSRIPLDMNDLYLTSSHAKLPNFDQILSYPKVAMVTDHLVGPSQIAHEIIKRKLKKIVWVGENLTYQDEKLTCFRPEELERNMHFNRNVVVILDEK